MNLFLVVVVVAAAATAVAATVAASAAVAKTYLNHSTIELWGRPTQTRAV